MHANGNTCTGSASIEVVTNYNISITTVAQRGIKIGNCQLICCESKSGMYVNPKQKSVSSDLD